MLGRYLLLGNKNEVLSDEEVLEQINHLKSRKPPGRKILNKKQLSYAISNWKTTPVLEG